jgi:hypothetical protein
MGIFVVIEGIKMNSFRHWLDFKFSMDFELEFLGQNQIRNWFEFLRA